MTAYLRQCVDLDAFFPMGIYSTASIWSEFNLRSMRAIQDCDADPDQPLSFHGNGHTGGSVPASMAWLAPGTEVTMPGNSGSLVRLHQPYDLATGRFAFAGWRTLPREPDAISAHDATYLPGDTLVTGVDPIDLFAIWNELPIAQRVTYDANASDTAGTLPVDAALYDAGDVVTVSGDEPTRVGFDFAGWNTAANGSGTAYAGAAVFTMESAAVTLYAQWTPHAWTVSFLAHGGSGDALTDRPVLFGATYGALPVLSRDGYAFAGWRLGSATGALVTEASLVAVDADHALDAAWIACCVVHYDALSVRFDPQGGTLAQTEISAPGLVYNALPTPPTRPGFVFNYWWTQPAGGVLVAGVPSPPRHASGNHTLYAHWTGLTYTVSFDAQGGSAPMPATSVVTAGAAYGVLPSITKTGQVFVGWFTAAIGGQRITADQVVEIYEPHTLYARWTPDFYTLAFDGNGSTGGSVPASPTLVAYGAAVSVPGNTGSLTRTGGSFIGWNTQPDGSGTAYAAGSTLTKDNGWTTLYAQWSMPGTLSVTFDSMGGSSCAAITVTPGLAYGALPEPTRTGFDFRGWWMTPGALGRINDAVMVTAEADHTLYALWAKQMGAAMRQIDTTMVGSLYFGRRPDNEVAPTPLDDLYFDRFEHAGYFAEEVSIVPFFAEAWWWGERWCSWTGMAFDLTLRMETSIAAELGGAFADTLTARVRKSADDDAVHLRLVNMPNLHAGRPLLDAADRDSVSYGEIDDSVTADIPDSGLRLRLHVFRGVDKYAWADPGAPVGTFPLVYVDGWYGAEVFIERIP